MDERWGMKAAAWMDTQPDKGKLAGIKPGPLSTTMLGLGVVSRHAGSLEAQR